MIRWDKENKQILTSKCLQCPDRYFAPYNDDYPHVGCCSYSPAFTLFEIDQMLLNQCGDFFWEKIYHNPKRAIQDYQIIIHAHVAKEFNDKDKDDLTRAQEEDLRLQFSVCQFFELGKGCGLNPAFKNQTCRSFICSTVEEELDIEEQVQLQQFVREIRSEVDQFNSKHEKILRSKGWTFKDNMNNIVKYLADLI